ncbi:MAG: 50S ribosomal protein L21 [Leptospirales bacterium]|nr:50S ribosomal protein L21 [Leptospirales bacterium]
MYAIVEIAGKQYKIEKDQTISVDFLDKQEDEIFDVSTVLLFADEAGTFVGKPYLENVKVKVQYLGDVKGDKVRGMKFKKRKGYTRTLGHRQRYSRLKISELAMN